MRPGFQHGLHPAPAVATMNGRNVNPFYIEKTNDWQQDVDDLDEEDELLGAFDDDGRYYSTPPPRRRRSTKRLAAVACLLLVLFFFVILSIGGSKRSSMNPSSDNKPDDIDGGNAAVLHDDAHARPDDDDDDDDEDDDDKQDDREPTKDPNQPTILVMGERHSGVPWLVEQLSKCFPAASVQSGWARPGYWFQSKRDLPTSSHTVLVIGVRDVRIWVDVMRRQPHYMPAHWNTTANRPLQWLDFCQRPWTTSRPPGDSQKAPSETCQLGFSYDQVIACHAIGAPTNDTVNPIYELASGGQPFANILALRSAKLRHFIEDVPQWYQSVLLHDDGDAPSAIVAQYEQDLMQPLAAIQTQTGWTPACLAQDMVGQRPKPADKALPPAYLEYLRNHVDWEMEAKVGYRPDLPIPTV